MKSPSLFHDFMFTFEINDKKNSREVNYSCEGFFHCATEIEKSTIKIKS